MLDPQTLVAAIMVTDLTLAIVAISSLGVRPDHRQWPGLRSWVGGMLLQAAGWFLRLVDIGFGPVFMAAAGMALVSLSFGLYWQGLRQFTGRQGSLAWIVVWPVVCAITQFVWYDDFVLRAAVVNTVIAVQVGAMGLVMASRPPDGHRPRGAAVFIVAAGVEAATLLLRTVTAVMAPGTMTDLYSASPLLNIGLLLSLMGQLTLHFGAIMFYAERIGWLQERLARIDPVAGVLNEAAFAQACKVESVRQKRHGTALTMALLEVDDLDVLRDGFDVETGDQVLRLVGREFRAGFGPLDVLGYEGGCRFAVLLPDQRPHEATKLLERLLRRVRAMDVPRCPASITLSAGLTSCVPGDPGLREARLRAAQALANAQANGRDRIELNLPAAGPGRRGVADSRHRDAESTLFPGDTYAPDSLPAG